MSAADKQGEASKSGTAPIAVAAPGSELVEKSLYAERERVYPREVDGRFTRLRWYAVWALLGLYYVAPWIPWGDRPMVLFDLPERKFHVLWFTFFPQDFLYLTIFLIICALLLFFFTALAGRMWCGYACPQTVWTEVYMWMERRIEGDRARRRKLDKAPWSAHKLRVKATKQVAWVLFSLWTGFTFVGFFVPITDLGARLLTLEWSAWEWFWVLFYGFATYGNAGYMREQVCTYMCPYARFQSAMFDRDTLIIAYDEARGEPRGSRRRGVKREDTGLGDCIDCTMCVQVCPTGIDIRDGLQYTCIACGACIDACDQVMDRMGYPRGLVRYATQNSVEHGDEPAHVLRPRTLIYATILAAITIAAVTSMALRTPLGLDIIRDRNALYRDTPEGLVENVYTLKIINMDRESHRYVVTASGVEGLELVMRQDSIEVATGEVASLPVTLRADPYDLPAPSSRVSFTLTAEDDPSLSVTEEARFLGPAVR